MGFFPFSSTLQAAGLNVTGNAVVGGTDTVNGLSVNNGGSSSAGSAPVLAPAFANGVAAQLADTTRDYMVYLTVGAAGTALVIAIGPTSGVADTVVPSSAATAGEVIAVRLPAGWFLKWSAVTATLAGQLAVGC